MNGPPDTYFNHTGFTFPPLVDVRRGSGWEAAREVILGAAMLQRPGIVGAHLLQQQTPRMAETTEQRIRNPADRVRDSVFVAVGYAAPVLEALVDGDLAPTTLRASGATEGALSAFYTLSHSATSEDIANVAPT